MDFMLGKKPPAKNQVIDFLNTFNSTSLEVFLVLDSTGSSSVLENIPNGKRNLN